MSRIPVATKYFRSTCRDVFLGKGLLKICSKFTGEHPCQSAISINLLCNLIEIALRHGCSVNLLLLIFRATLPKSISGRLLLIFSKSVKTNSQLKV